MGWGGGGGRRQDPINIILPSTASLCSTSIKKKELYPKTIKCTLIL